MLRIIFWRRSKFGPFQTEALRWSRVPFWVILLLPLSLISPCNTFLLIHFKPVTSVSCIYFKCAGPSPISRPFHLVFPLPEILLLQFFTWLNLSSCRSDISLLLKEASLITLSNEVFLFTLSFYLLLSHITQSIIILFVNAFFLFLLINL